MQRTSLPPEPELDNPPTGPGYHPHTLVLLGAGHAHVHVLQSLAAQPLVGVQVVLVAPHPRQMYSGMVPGLVAGRYALEDCTIALEPLVKRAGVRWLQCSAKAIDANTQTLELDENTELHYDWLSINTGPVQNRDALERSMPGVRTHGLFVRPIEGFAGLWPQVLAMGRAQALRMAVVGGGAAGIELVLALRQQLPQAALTLVCGDAPPGAHYGERMRQRIATALKRQRVTVLQDFATGFSVGAVQLGCGATLACDVPIIATGAQAPAWLQGSTLALDAQGFVAVDACQRSTSHAHVFAVGDVSTRTDRVLARSGVYAVRAGPALVRNLRAAATGIALVAHQPPANTLNLLSCGDGTALGTWGNWSFQGRWVWWLKDWIDRRFVARYRDPA